MKTTLNIEELKEMNACADVYKTFKKAHGSETVTLSQAFESNGWDDIWWFIGEAYESFSDEQKKDLRLLAADYAERVLPIFKKEFPNDDRPELAIKAARDYANGLIDKADWDAAWTAAWTAVWASEAAAWAASDAAWAASDAARAAAWAASDAASDAARDAAWAAAKAAAWDAERKWQEEKLLDLFSKWGA